MEVIKTAPVYLGQYVKFFYSVKGFEPGSANAVHRRLPDGTLDLVFNLGDPVLVSKDGVNYHEMPREMLTGLHLDRQFVNYRGRVHLTGVVFQPGFAHFFVQDSLAHFTSCYIEAPAVYGTKISDLAELLVKARTEEEKHTLLERFLIKYMESKGTGRRNELISSAIKKIHLSNGTLGIGSLYKDACMSESTFRRAFNEFVGIGPKDYSCIIRVKSFSKYYERQRTSYVNIADTLGYSDQSHFNKDFQKIAGVSPSMYFGQLNKIGTEFIHLI